MRYKAAMLGLLALGLVLGCKDTEQKRNRVSGKVTFNGQAIPYGEVLFTPDDSKKNSGAQGIATIRDGQYDTSAAGGKGYGGGPAVIRVTGLSGEGGKILCEYQFRVEQPQSDASLDIDVPLAATSKTGAAPGP